MTRLIAWFKVDDWKRGVALVILWTYAYQLVIWPPLFWLTTLITMATGWQCPGPPLLPWEAQATGTATLAAVGGIETWREGRQASRRQLDEGDTDG